MKGVVILMQENNVMLDLETMGNSKDAAIISIGAVIFYPEKMKLGSEFHSIVDLESSVSLGLTMNATTVMWWMGQSKEAREQFNSGSREQLQDVLFNFSMWLRREGGVYIWGNGAAFDNVILAEAYRRCGRAVPWSYRNDRCYHTMKGLYPGVPMLQRVGTYHSAIDDAKSQALHLMQILRR
jgi:3'-5' exoribonuclease-like protein